MPAMAAEVGAHMDRMKAWIDSFASDIFAVQALLADDKAADEARLRAASALNYLVTRLDLIPDWEETCGILDDAMIVRLAMSQAADKDLGGLSGDALHTVARLANEVELVREFLGDDLYPRLKKYAEELVHAVVRNRSPRALVDDAKARRLLFDEIKDELKRLPPAPMSDPDRVARTIKNYLTQKLA
jgi:uncharacterized membrane protein YkvA (DUF1232 family)